MDIANQLKLTWTSSRERLSAKGLLKGGDTSLSLRIPGADAMWFGCADVSNPSLICWRDESVRDHAFDQSLLHATIYDRREDVCAICIGSGPYGVAMEEFGSLMPGIFDEQVRHLGLMPEPVNNAGQMAFALGSGGNVLFTFGSPVVLGMTANRLLLNSELFEKCAKAYVLALAAGGRVKALPWIVRWVANSRLRKDQRRAKARVQSGLLPEETKGY